jgi:hypothetical protein
MKIRNGFVSNSSSSSFLIYGAFIGDSELAESKMSLINSEGLHIEYGPPYCRDGVYVGKSWDMVGDDETGKQFKSKIEKSLKKIFPDSELSFSSYEESWQDG